MTPFRISIISIFTVTALHAQITVDDTSRDAFSKPMPMLRGERISSFFVGNSFFNQNWVAAPASAAGRDGLGPLFNARSCSSCHFKDGRGAPAAEGFFDSTSLRLHPASPGYGRQIQTAALPGVTVEAKVDVRWQTIIGAFADGQTFSLRRPSYHLENPGYGPMPGPASISARVAPALVGLGLLEAVPDQRLVEMEDPDDRDGDGISGTAKRLENGRIGRFGWKAEQPSLEAQIALAFSEDMGLTSGVIPTVSHTAPQGLDDTGGGTPEVSEKIFRSVVGYCSSLAVPAPRNVSDPEVARGRKIFADLRCGACHAPDLKTVATEEFPEWDGGTIQPYTDLLLHDLGEGLADPGQDTESREWRTAPLWGIGLVPKVNGHTFFLHDGRARNLTEAILWHGGEASATQETFRQLPAADRQALLRFIESL